MSNKKNMKNTIKPKLSIVVPVYNVENYLERCVNSLINQTFSNFEIILVDDGSPDRSGLMCDSIQKKIREFMPYISVTVV